MMTVVMMNWLVEPLGCDGVIRSWTGRGVRKQTQALGCCSLHHRERIFARFGCLASSEVTWGSFAARPREDRRPSCRSCLCPSRCICNRGRILHAGCAALPRCRRVAGPGYDEVSACEDEAAATLILQASYRGRDRD